MTLYAGTAPVTKVYAGAIEATKVYAGAVLVYGGSAPPPIGLRNSFMGIASGDAVTSANSGGLSGDSFNTVVGSVVCNTSADLTDAYDRGAACSLSGGQNAYAEWLHSQWTAAINVGMYVRRSATPGVTQRIGRGYNGAALAWELRWQADGALIVTEPGGSWVCNVTGATKLNQVYRIEMRLLADGTATLGVYEGESSTPINPNTPQPGRHGAAFDRTRLGLMTTSNQTMSIDIAALSVAPG